MGDSTGIEWADATVNIWTGCTKISPACKNCYAETNSPVRVMEARVGEALGVAPNDDGRRRLRMWGEHGFRYETANWEAQLRRFNRAAARKRVVCAGRGEHYDRPRVFINSLSDTFEDWLGPVYRLDDGNPVIVAHSINDVRARFFRVAEECTELDLLLLTKRPENVLGMVSAMWWGTNDFSRSMAKWPAHIWLGTTAENQDCANKRIPALLQVPAKVRFLSVEPLLKFVAISGLGPINWVIVGGESGHNARPMHPDWVRSIRDQCVATGVPFFFKQWGEHEYDRRMFTSSGLWEIKGHGWLAGTCAKLVATDGSLMHNGGDIYRAEKAGLFPLAIAYKVGKKNAGRIIDGRTWDEVPK